MPLRVGLRSSDFASNVLQVGDDVSFQWIDGHHVPSNGFCDCLGTVLIKLRLNKDDRNALFISLFYHGSNLTGLRSSTAKLHRDLLQAVSVGEIAKGAVLNIERLIAERSQFLGEFAIGVSELLDKLAGVFLDR